MLIDYGNDQKENVRYVNNNGYANNNDATDSNGGRPISI